VATAFVVAGIGNFFGARDAANWHEKWGILAFGTEVLVLGALALATVASGAASETGVTSTQVTIGGTTPLSGPASAYQSVAKGAAAYFRYVNAKGGVNKRKINYIYKDDAYDPSKTVDATRELVSQDKVFAIFNSLGTDQNLATRAYLNALKVPQLFVASGATTFGNDYKKYPYTIGYQPNYRAEGTIYGRYVVKHAPKARIGVLYQNDDYGKDLLAGLQRGLGAKAALVKSKQSYNVDDPDVQSQIAKLKAAKVNTLMVFATPKFAIQAYVYARKLSWKPLVYMNAVSSAANIMGLSTAATNKKQTEGTISIVFLKDPTDPAWRNNSGMKLYRSIMKKYKGGNPNDVYAVYGMSVAHTFVAALQKAGKNPTRAGIMKAADSLNVTNDPFLLPGISVKTSATDHFPLDQAKLQRYHDGHWVAFGGLFRVR
jgi:branched-chain amino acid transport system substrate-binding protein